jgi:ceramide glucosyltransferase
MLAAMLFLFYFLAVEQIVQGFWSLWQGLQWSRMAKRRVAMPLGFFTPRVALFCPVKGLEPDLEQNLAVLLDLDYVPYEVFFAISSADDPAYRLLDRLAASAKRPVHIVCAGRPRDCGEKVHNLRTAVERAGGEFDVFVFADSDGRPPRRWLARLIAPLADPQLGAATTFRWLFPRRGGFWSALASAWNAPAATFLGDHDHNFCWGGGTAIRSDRFQEIRALEAWAGSVSDDFSLTLALWRAGFAIAFVPECLVPSVIDMNAKSLFEFTNRQFVITRVYAPKIWARAALGHLFYCGAVLIGLGIWIAAWSAGVPSLHILILATLPPLLCAARGTLRLAAVLDLLPEWRQKLLFYGWAWTLLAPLVPFLSLYNVAVAAFRRKIIWRGMRYELVSAAQTRIVAR